MKLKEILKSISEFLICISLPGLNIAQHIFLLDKVVNLQRRIRITKNGKLIWIGNLSMKRSIVVGDRLTIPSILDNIKMVKAISNKIAVLENGMEMSHESYPERFCCSVRKS